jgi:hypothetical protein
MSKTPDEIRDRAEHAKAAARQGNFTPLFQLSDADYEYILANGLHDRATYVSRRLVRSWGWPEEQIRRHYPPCECERCTLWREEREMAGG